MAGKPEYDKTISTHIVLAALNSLGVMADASGRNDLVVKTPDGDRKVSGSAYRETKDRGFHHGTLLLNADLSRLANYLNPDKKKLAAKGITSVRSRVANLTELLPGITHEQVCQAVTEAFFAHYGERVDAEVISPDKTPDLPNFAERLQGCLYRADKLQETCEALLVDFPEQEKELRELSAWIAEAVR